MKKKLVMEIYEWVVRKLLTDLQVDQVNSAIVSMQLKEMDKIIYTKVNIALLTFFYVMKVNKK